MTSASRSKGEDVARALVEARYWLNEIDASGMVELGDSERKHIVAIIKHLTDQEGPSQ